MICDLTYAADTRRASCSCGKWTAYDVSERESERESERVHGIHRARVLERTPAERLSRVHQRAVKAEHLTPQPHGRMPLNEFYAMLDTVSAAEQITAQAVRKDGAS